MRSRDGCIHEPTSRLQASGGSLRRCRRCRFGRWAPAAASAASCRRHRASTSGGAVLQQMRAGTLLPAQAPTPRAGIPAHARGAEQVSSTPPPPQGRKGRAEQGCGQARAHSADGRAAAAAACAACAACCAAANWASAPRSCSCSPATCCSAWRALQGAPKSDWFGSRREGAGMAGPPSCANARSQGACRPAAAAATAGGSPAAVSKSSSPRPSCLLPSCHPAAVPRRPPHQSSSLCI